MAYASIGLVTDTDCWKDSEHVTADLVVQRFKEFARLVVDILYQTIDRMRQHDWQPMISRRQVIKIFEMTNESLLFVFFEVG